MTGDSPEDRAIKKSAMDVPPFEARDKVSRLEGTEKDEMVKKIVDAKNVDLSYTHVNIYNYPAFSKAWDHMLVNFYYSHTTDPMTTIQSYRVCTSGKITNA